MSNSSSLLADTDSASCPRVLHLIDHMGLGGAQTAVLSQLKHRPGDLVFVLREKGLRRELLPGAVWSGASTPLGLMAALPRLVSTINDNAIDIVHCHLRYSWLMGLIASYLTPAQVVFHERGWILLGGWPYKLLARRCARRGYLVSVSEYCASRLSDIGIAAERVRVIQNGLDRTKFRPDPSLRAAARRLMGINGKGPVIGFAGRWIAYKGWRTFVETMALLNDNPARPYFAVIAGAGPDSRKLHQEILRLNLENRIQVVGFVEDMTSFYNAVDLIVMPSCLEPLGRVQIEAQACGVPVVGASVPGMSETINERNALLVESGLPSHYASAIRRLLEDPQYARSLVAAGMENVERFNEEIYLERMERHYANVLGVS